MHTHSHSSHHDCHNHLKTERSIRLLGVSFAINMMLTLVELIAGIIAGSMALIGDALHNCSDAFSILIAIIAYKIGIKKATEKFSYGFKRAETIGAGVNSILLFISGLFLIFEGIERMIKPEMINGRLIVIVSILALIIDALTAKISHAHAHHNMNMKMLFVHNLADAFGSIGVIVSGLFVMYLNWTFVDGVIACMIGLYMMAQSIHSFPKIVKILMNCAPDDLDLSEIKKAILKIKGVQDIHHLHVWQIDEQEVSFECHIVSCDLNVLEKIQQILAHQFNITHTNIQIEQACCSKECCF